MIGEQPNQLGPRVPGGADNACYHNEPPRQDTENCFKNTTDFEWFTEGK
jgi:hypothetical protein